MGTAPGLGERQRAQCGCSGRHRSPSSQHPTGSLPAAVLGEAGHLAAHTWHSHSPSRSAAYTRGRLKLEGKGQMGWEREASRRSLGTGRGHGEEGRKGRSLCREDPSLSLSFPSRKKKRKTFPCLDFFSQRPRPLPVKPHLKPPCRHGNGPKGTDGPGEPNPNSRGSSAGVRAGQEQALATRLRGDREVSSLTLLCLVLQPWQGVRRLGATSGRPRRREGHARSPPKGHEPSETHHPVSWTSLATGRAASSQTSPASPCPPLANLTPYDGGLHSTWLWGPDFFICEVSRHRAQLAQPCQVSQTDSSEQTGDEDWVG